MKRKSKYDSTVELYRGAIPRAVVLGLIKRESNFNPRATNRAPNAPGGGPKIGLLQPSQTGLRDALEVSVVQESILKNSVHNIRIGTTILNDYWQKLRRDFPRGFAKPLSADANAVAILVLAYSYGYSEISSLMRKTRTTSYRQLANQNPTHPGVARQWPDRVLSAARRYGYTQILPAAAGGRRAGPNVLLPDVPPASAAAEEKQGSALPWLLGAAALGGLALVLSRKKRR